MGRKESNQTNKQNQPGGTGLIPGKPQIFLLFLPYQARKKSVILTLEEIQVAVDECTFWWRVSIN